MCKTQQVQEKSQKNKQTTTKKHPQKTNYAKKYTNRWNVDVDEMRNTMSLHPTPSLNTNIFQQQQNAP